MSADRSDIGERIQSLKQDTQSKTGDSAYPKSMGQVCGIVRISGVDGVDVETKPEMCCHHQVCYNGIYENLDMVPWLGLHSRSCCAVGDCRLDEKL